MSKKPFPQLGTVSGHATFASPHAGEMMLPKVRLARGRRFPVMTFEFDFAGLGQMRTASLLRNVGMVRRWFNWRIVENGESYWLHDGGETLRLTRQHLSIIAHEWNEWKRIYMLPAFSLPGKTVLDVGCGCGETAHFYYRQGARKVVGIEPNQVAAECFRENGKHNNWNSRLLERKFRLEDLRIRHDFMKMDGEGCEKLLLKNSVEDIGPCVIEAHSISIARRLVRKFRLQFVWTNGRESILHTTTS